MYLRKSTDGTVVVRMSQKFEDRLRKLEARVDRAEPLIQQIADQLELEAARLNPAKYCKDELDKKIIDYLIENQAAGTTEIAKALGLSDPKLVGRHTIGKRIQALNKKFEYNGWHILTFHPENKEGKFRAWWIDISQINVEAFRKKLR